MVIAIGSVIVSYLIVKLAKGMKITFSVVNFRVLITFRKLVLFTVRYGMAEREEGGGENKYDACKGG